MSHSPDESRADRYARALSLAGDYRRRQQSGTAEPLVQFLLAHADLRFQLEALLADDTVLPAGVPEAGRHAPLPARIGPYRLLSLLGSGGMGTVWLAERDDTAQRVALKVVRKGLDSAALMARFTDERRALAKMNHDAIARVFDVGTTDEGEPYFVMEWVEDGVPLTTWCDRRALPISERIRLFQQVCAGVQHAHHKGVVHRDLKPGNVLVAVQGERVVVKVIDFGIAGKLQADPGSQSADRPIGTPEYMSPEQAEGEASRIDSRSDVYSLGVMLYELLAGALPFASADLRSLPTGSLRQRLRDEIPPRPSTRVATDPARSTTSAAARGLTARRLQQCLRGDLDWIVQKAIAKDPDDRYPSPRDLALDLRRHLDQLPVSAAPDRFAYRASKFVARNRGLVAAGTIVVLALGTGVAATMRQFLRAEQRADQVDQLAGLVLYERAQALSRELNPPWPSRIADMERWLAVEAPPVSGLTARVDATLAELRIRALPATTPAESPAGKPAELRFHDPSDQYLYQALADLQGKLQYFAECVDVVERRLGWARALPHWTAHHPHAGCSWQQAADAIARHDDYRGTPLRIGPEDLIGLVPIGRNPATGLWEFYDLLTGWNWRSPPERIAVPHYGGDGQFVAGGCVGLVFVLVPGEPASRDRSAVPAFLLARTDLDATQRWRLLTWSAAERMSGHEATVSAQVRRSHALDGVLTKQMLQKHGMSVPTPVQLARLQRLLQERPALVRCFADPASGAADDYSQRPTRVVAEAVAR